MKGSRFYFARIGVGIEANDSACRREHRPLDQGWGYSAMSASLGLIHIGGALIVGKSHQAARWSSTSVPARWFQSGRWVAATPASCSR